MTYRSVAAIDCDRWQQTDIMWQGQRYRVEGYVEDTDEHGNTFLRCPTEICKAACCRTADIFDGRIGSGPCRFLSEENLCSIHGACKPVSCLIWPVHPGDIESTNEKCERLGIAERCQLKMVPVDGDD